LTASVPESAEESAKPELSIVIVSYKVRDRLRQCLESLRSQLEGTPRFETIVVDNDSGDGTVQELSGSFPEVRFLAMDRNLGFSIGCNRGASLATGEWILFLNPDTVVFPETLRDIVAFARAREDLGIVGCRILDGDGKLQLACRRSIPTPEVAFWRLSGLSFLFPRSRRLGRYNLAYLDPVQSYPVEAVSGSFLLIRTRAFRQVGGFDEVFFLYGEDLDLCLRVSRAGWTIWYSGESSIVHHKGQSAAARPWGARMDFYRAMVTFARKNFGVGPTVGSILSVVAWLLATGAHLGQYFQRMRDLAMDLAGVNIAFFLVSTFWLWTRHPELLTDVWQVSWMWLFILSGCLLGVLIAFGEYGPGLTRRSTLVTALGAGLGGFLVVGFVIKSAVFSRASFILGGLLACVLVAARHSWTSRKRFLKPRRAVVAGTSQESVEMARRLQGSSRVRVLGFLAREGEDLAGEEGIVAMARLPLAFPALRALEVSTVVVPAAMEGVGALLEELAGLRQIRILLALPVPKVGEPVLVDITLDHNFPPERPE
jgi:GT2 family glycosyltransferase